MKTNIRCDGKATDEADRARPTLTDVGHKLSVHITLALVSLHTDEVHPCRAETPLLLLSKHVSEHAVSATERYDSLGDTGYI